jgi:hypothetical protein
MRNRAISQSSLIAIVFTAAGFLSILPMQAQNAARNVNPATTPDSADPSGYTSPAAPTVATASSTPASTTPTWHETAVPADKEITTKVINGVLTVDGLVAKVQLNYEIHHAGYLYIFVPGVGTAVVSRVQTYGSTKVLNAFHGSDLAFSVGGHNFELASQSPMVAAKEDAYVRLDPRAVCVAALWPGREGHAGALRATAADAGEPAAAHDECAGADGSRDEYADEAVGSRYEG